MTTQDLSKQALETLQEGNTTKFIAIINQILEQKSTDVVSSYMTLPEKTEDSEVETVSEITEADLDNSFLEYEEIVLEYPDGTSITVSEESLQKIADVYAKLNEDNKAFFVKDLNSPSPKVVNKLIAFCNTPEADVE